MDIDNRVVVKAGIREDRPENKYTLGVAKQEASQDNMLGLIVEVNGIEKFYYREQCVSLKKYKREVGSLMESLEILEKLGFDVKELYIALAEFKEDL